MEEVGKPTNVGFAKLPFPIDHLGGHTTRAEDRQQVGLSEVALFHEVLQDLKRRDFGHFHSIVIVLDESLQQCQECVLFWAGRPPFSTLRSNCSIVAT